MFVGSVGFGDSLGWVGSPVGAGGVWDGSSVVEGLGFDEGGLVGGGVFVGEVGPPDGVAVGSGSLVGCSDDDGSPDGDAVGDGLAVAGSGVSHSAGSWKSPSAITSKCRWQLVAYPLSPTRPTP